MGSTSQTVFFDRRAQWQGLGIGIGSMGVSTYRRIFRTTGKNSLGWD